MALIVLLPLSCFTFTPIDLRLKLVFTCRRAQQQVSKFVNYDQLAIRFRRLRRKTYLRGLPAASARNGSLRSLETYLLTFL